MENSKLKWQPVVLCCLLCACGGGPKQDTAPVAEESSEEVEEEATEQVDVHAFEEMKRIFDGKQRIVSRCYVAGIDAGELAEHAKGYATLHMVMTAVGRATKVTIAEGNLKSQAFERCLINYVEGWQFPEIPHDVDYSHTYNFQQF